MLDMEARQRGGLIAHYESTGIFADRVRRLIELGISEIGIFYPRREEQLPVFEKIAAEVMPVLRAEYAERDRK